ncbi:MAG: CHAT domain-containing protein [Luteitalea sp.]|nr:CHAT domain-containing protein [Luteitalea sp.]
MRAQSIQLLFLVLSMAVPAVVDASSSRSPFSECWDRFDRSPDDHDSAYCFYEVTFQNRLWTEGGRLFEQLIDDHPENFWLPLAYGHVHRARDPDRAEELYRQSANGFREVGNAEGEVLARSNLRDFLFPKGRVKEATEEMQRVVQIAASVHDPILEARARMLEAAHIQDIGGDLGVAYRLLKQAERTIFPDGPYRLQRTALMSLGAVTFRMGRLDDALATFEKLEALAAAEAEGLVQANARYNILTTSALKETLVPTPGGRERLMRLAKQSLATGIAAQNRTVTVRTHQIIAALLAPEEERQAEALEHVERCLHIATKARMPHDEAACSWIAASLLHDKAPDRARAAELRALESTERANNPRTQAYGAGQRMRSSWKTKPRAHAIRDSLETIDAIETLRSLQEDSNSSAELFSTWTRDYYWFSGRLLRDHQEQDLDLAFSITERMRARSLLDRLGRSQTRLDSEHPAVANRRSLLEAIAAVQRRLMDPTITDDTRQETLQKLEALERQEQEAQRQIALAGKRRHQPGPAFASLGAVQSALAANEALLSFQVGNWETYEEKFAGGSWLIALTRDGRWVYRIPDRAQLAPIVPIFSGVLARADDAGTAAATRLYDDLLADALSALPPGIERLILVPDGPLHRLPFDALRSARDATPLAARHELVTVPSATLWLHWRQNESRPSSPRALAFADPELGSGAGFGAAERNAVLHEGLRLGRLPHARRETRALARHIGSVDALVGSGASERALKDRDLREYSILHFAAHAVADETHPARSAVLLSPGADTEDGLLQAREIEELDLDGVVVVLSACQTASGAILSGEGVLSLARAFFEAGAKSVIGTRWPIRDEDAAALFDDFYRALGEGASLSTALTHAKVEAIEAGRPASAWASLVVLGDGGFQPVLEGRHETSRSRPLVITLAVTGLLLLALAARWTARGWRSTRAR